MAAHRRRTHFATPFIVVLGCGGAQRPDPPDVPGAKWSVSVRGDECYAYSPMGHCPKGARCNPPPPRPVECPTGLTAGATVRIVQRPDATCGIIPEQCVELACVVQTTPCPTERGAPRRLTGPSWQVTRSDDASCFARVDTCASTETGCAQAIECPPTAPVRITRVEGRCVIVPEGCTDSSCASQGVECPMPVGKDLGALKWLGERVRGRCIVRSAGPIEGEREQEIACPADPRSSATFQIDRPTRADECVYRAGAAPPATTPCPR